MGPLETAALTAVHITDNAYSTSIIAQIEKLTDTRCTAGAVWTVLDRLVKSGLLAARSNPHFNARNGQPKTFYKLTKDGERELLYSVEVMRRITTALNSH